MSPMTADPSENGRQFMSAQQNILVSYHSQISRDFLSQLTGISAMNCALAYGLDLSFPVYKNLFELLPIRTGIMAQNRNIVGMPMSMWVSLYYRQKAILQPQIGARYLNSIRGSMHNIP